MRVERKRKTWTIILLQGIIERSVISYLIKHNIAIRSNVYNAISMQIKIGLLVQVAHAVSLNL